MFEKDIIQEAKEFILEQAKGARDYASEIKSGDVKAVNADYEELIQRADNFEKIATLLGGKEMLKDKIIKNAKGVVNVEMINIQKKPIVQTAWVADADGEVFNNLHQSTILYKKGDWVVCDNEDDVYPIAKSEHHKFNIVGKEVNIDE